MNRYTPVEAQNSHSITLYRNAQIYTANRANLWAEALAVAEGRLLAVGTEQSILRDVLYNAATETEVVDLTGRFVMPGICDSHIHLYDLMTAADSTPLAGCRSLHEMLERITKARERRQIQPRPTQQQWLCGQGWNESRWHDPRYPTAGDLQSATGADLPAIFWRSDMHVAVCNHAALEMAGITAGTSDPPGGRIGRDTAGAANGLLFDTAINLVSQLIPPLEGHDLTAAIRSSAARLHSLGLTSIHDQRLQSGEDGSRMLAAYSQLHQQGALPLRVHCNIGGRFLDHALALGLRSGFGDEWLRIGHVKYFIDGSLGSRTAWMLAPYEDDPYEGDKNEQGAGLCVTSPEALRDDFLRAMQGGLAISVHAIGDRANREVLDLFEELSPHAPPPPIPHRVEHVQIIASEDIPRLAKLRLTASVQPTHTLDDIEIAQRYLGDRGRWAYPFRDLAQHGARLAFGSDAPVADPNPFLGIHAAVLRIRPQDPAAQWFPEQGISLDQALLAYTLGPAEAVGCQTFCGTLEVGKCADFIVLNQNPFELLREYGESANLAGIAVDMTVLAGTCVYQRQLEST